MERFGTIVFVVALIALYLLPWVIASSRKHHQTDAICVLTLFGGWTGIGWFIALVWACTAVQENRGPRARIAFDDRPEELVIGGRRNCTNCGATWARSSRFCGSCGAQL